MILLRKPKTFEELVEDFKSFIQYELNKYDLNNEDGKVLKELYPTKEEYEAKLLEALIFSYNNGLSTRMINSIIKNKDLHIQATAKNQYGNDYIYQFYIKDNNATFISGSANSGFYTKDYSIEKFNDSIIEGSMNFRIFTEDSMNKNK